MSKKLGMVVMVNVIIALIFAYANVAYWNLANGHPAWSNPIYITVQLTPPGEMAGFTLVPNIMFELFWISMVVNLVFAIWLQRSREES